MQKRGKLSNVSAYTAMADFLTHCNENYALLCHYATSTIVVISYRRFGTTYLSRAQRFKNPNEFSCSMTGGKQLISYTIFRNRGPWKQHNQLLTVASSYSPWLHYLNLQLLAIPESKKRADTERACECARCGRNRKKTPTVPSVDDRNILKHVAAEKKG